MIKKTRISAKRVKLDKFFDVPIDIQEEIAITKEKGDEELIQYFVNSKQLDLHPTRVTIVRNNDIIILFGSHSFKEKNVIIVVYDNEIYQFVGWRKNNLFCGGVSKRIFATTIFGVKPVEFFIGGVKIEL